MFSWYQRSAECYAFLDDLHAYQRVTQNDTTQTRFDHEAFYNSRWFTRGWTLQELLAPSEVLFFDKSGVFIGSRTQICPLISKATGIDPGYLEDNQSIWEASIAQRVSWASKRTTTRQEDIAYSLLGIFDVNMALLYGEGEKAFQRLQDEIIKQSDDESIFAWGLDKDYPEATGVLAQSPADFAGSEDVITSPGPTRLISPRTRRPHFLTNKGIEYTQRTYYPDYNAWLNKWFSEKAFQTRMRLACLGRSSNENHDIVLSLQSDNKGDQYHRLKAFRTQQTSSSNLYRLTFAERQLYLIPSLGRVRIYAYKIDTSDKTRRGSTTTIITVLQAVYPLLTSLVAVALTVWCYKLISHHHPMPALLFIGMILLARDLVGFSQLFKAGLSFALIIVGMTISHSEGTATKYLG